MSTKSNPYCCVDADGHIWHHCVHRSLDEAIDKARSIEIPEETHTKLREVIESIINDKSNT